MGINDWSGAKMLTPKTGLLSGVSLSQKHRESTDSNKNPHWLHHILRRLMRIQTVNSMATMKISENIRRG